jgi:hypothetical protein
MGIFGDILGEIGGAAGSLVPLPFGLGSTLGREGGKALGGLIPFRKGGQVVMTSMGPMMMKPSKAKKGKSTTAMKRKMAKVRAAKKK